MMSLKGFIFLAVCAVAVTISGLNSWLPMVLLGATFAFLVALVIPILLQPRRARLAKEKAAIAKQAEERKPQSLEIIEIEAISANNTVEPIAA